MPAQVPMRVSPIVSVVVAVLLLAASASAQEINLSHDLLRLGIGANMEPNRRDLDSRPLFQAAVAYIERRPISRVTLDPGDYYFLTRQENSRYIDIENLRDVAFAFAGVNLYFREASGGHALVARDSERVTFSGFTIDFLELPFTQVRVAQVQPEERTIRFEALAGYRPATELNDFRGPTGNAPEMYGIVLRNGTNVPGRFALQGAITPNTIGVEGETYWGDPSTIARYLPGDTLVIMGRNEGSAIRLTGGRDVAFEDIEIYASGSTAVFSAGVVGVRLERVRVLPRPGTDRLISTNAGGLQFGELQAGSAIRNSEVRRTLDDGIGVYSVWLAAVLEAPSPSRLVVQRLFRRQFENGLLVSFVDTATAQELAGGRIVSQVPAYDAPAVSEGTVELEFDRGLPPLSRDAGMVYADAAQRGQGTVVENNLVEDVLNGRGIYLAGVVGVRVQGNTIRRTASAGIGAAQAMNPPNLTSPPVRDLQILGNTVEQPIHAGRSFTALGGITVISPRLGRDPLTGSRLVTTRANRQVVIAGNRISQSGRAGIWVSNVAGGSIRDNVIVSHNRRPNIPLAGVPAPDLADMEPDFAKAVVVRASDAVEETGNVVQAAAGFRDAR